MYDWPRVWALVRRLQPDAVIFSDAGPDVRWCGNENGEAGDPNWSTMNPDAVPIPGASGPGVTRALLHGDPSGTIWRPAEADVSIRPGWFYHPAEDSRVRTSDHLFELYLTSVGRNSKLLLNVPPTRDGLFHDADIASLTGFQNLRRWRLAPDLASGAHVAWQPDGRATEIDLGRSANVSIVRLEEDIAQGQVIAAYSLFGSDGGPWRVLARGTTIGYARIVRSEPSTVRRVRLVIDDAIAPPGRIAVKVYAG